MKTVRISLKAARELVGWEPMGNSAEHRLIQSALREVRDAIAKAQRASATRRRLAKPRLEKKAKKREEDAELRAALLARCGGSCELCTRVRPLEPHHALGRARAEQGPHNVLAVCRRCHDGIHTGDRALWLLRQANEFARLGHHDAAAELRKKLEWLEARKAGGL